MPSFERRFSRSGDTLPIAPKLRYDYRWGRSMAANEREFDIILFGATGFTGKLVAEYLLRQYGINEGLRWAIAGRNPGKLKEIATSLGTGGCEVPRLEADSNSAKDMNRLAAQAKVVCTTVGPYAKYGSLLLGACVERGTHYCDLTAEIPWMVRMMNQHQAQALTTGARIVHACGFDSIPSDLGAFFMHSEMSRQHGVPCRRIQLRVEDFSGGFSGGTVASLLHMMEEAETDDRLRDLLQAPYALDPEGSPKGADEPESLVPRYDESFSQWLAPFPMAAVNTKVVRRSNALLEQAYGPDFRYDEAMLAGGGPTGLLRAAGTSVGSGLSMGLLSIPPLRKLLAKRLPAPGEGPGIEEREAGYWKIRLLGVHPIDPAKNLEVRLTGDRDPGYGSTSKMLGETAVCLAINSLPDRAGFLTTAVAMGDPLIDRLQKNAGIKFEILHR